MPSDLEEQFFEETIKEYTNPENMETLKSGEFSNQLFLALCGESVEEFKARVEKETNQKRLLDKMVTIKKMLRLGKLSIPEISYLFEVSEDFVQEIQSKME